ncbi:hypothetical protein [Pedobacter sp.]|uniref:hypothetical protein n=1 Tax=Pedobacter sp. TaxID=1411316 RepID=UPI0031D77D3B
MFILNYLLPAADDRVSFKYPDNISYLGIPRGTFPDYYYLYPTASNQIVLNPKIIQNPGWK